MIKMVQDARRTVSRDSCIHNVHVCSKNGLLRENDCDVTLRNTGSSYNPQTQNEQRGRSEGQRGLLENGGCSLIKEIYKHLNTYDDVFILVPLAFQFRHHHHYFSTPVAVNIDVTSNTFM